MRKKIEAKIEEERKAELEKPKYKEDSSQVTYDHLLKSIRRSVGKELKVNITNKIF